MRKRLIIFLGIAIIIVLFVFLDYSDILDRTSNIPQVSTKSGSNTLTTEEIENIPRLSVVAENLEVPWALVFLPDGGILVTERKGTVRLINNEGNLLTEPVAEIDVDQTQESGLHGIALHPAFQQNNFVYLYYTYEGDQNNSLNRVSKFEFTDNKLINETTIVDNIPGARFHDGGRIKFGPDGFLYITTGDATKPSLAQNLDSLAGKILRVTDSGNSAPGNPFGTRIYSYGHRNPQGITWDTEGNLWETEHGPSAADELNLIEPGKNYGWPTIKGDEIKNGMVTAILNSGEETWAPAGLAYINGSLYFAGLRGNALFEVKIDEDMKIIEHLSGELGRIRAVVTGPDGMLYVSTSNRDGRGVPSPNDDRIIRINTMKL